MRLVGLLSVLALVLSIISCGPGSGGTGTGPTTSLISGSATFASSSAATLNPPPSMRLHLEPSSVELSTGCVRFLHEGSWSLDSGHQGTITGTLQVSSGGATRSTPGSLQLAFDGQPSGQQVLTLFDLSAVQQVTFTLFDQDGRVVLGPQTLRRQDGATAPATGSCSS